jgi:hypothetical protein
MPEGVFMRLPRLSPQHSVSFTHRFTNRPLACNGAEASACSMTYALRVCPPPGPDRSI